MIRLPASGAVLGRCVCGAVVRKDDWRDECSEREWLLSGLCQDCQDRIFLASDGNARHPLRFGALAAHSVAGRDLTELAVLPFLFIPETGTVAWEARYALCIGPQLSSGLLSDLNPMAWMLAGNLLRVIRLHDLAEPLLADFSDLDLLLALDHNSLETIVGACPPLGGGFGVALSDALDWRSLAGRPLLPLGEFVHELGLEPSCPGSSPPPSPLRLCAQMGAALGLAGGRPLAQLLDFVEDRLPETAAPRGG